MPDNDKQANIQKELDPAILMNEAEEITGLSDYGDMYFLGPLTEQVNRFVREVDFNEQGLKQQKSDYCRHLVNRLRTQDDIKRHPEILDEDVSDPMIIIGLARSGTTKLHRLMGTEPNAQKLYAWRQMNPALFPDAIPGQPDPRLTAGGDDILDGKQNAKIGSAHASRPDMVESETAMFEQTFDLGVMGMSHRLPVFQYDHWAPGKPDTDGDREAYLYLRILLKYLQWQDGGKRNRPWFLKNVIHHPHLDTVLECFPKATFVHCQRDPLDSIASYAKLAFAACQIRADNIDKRFVSEGVLNCCAAGMARYLEARDRLQLDDRIVDAKYENIRNDVMPIIREAYERAGLKLSAEAEQGMLQWERDNEQHKHGKHTYSLQEFGFSKEMIDHAFADFIDRFVDR